VDRAQLLSPLRAAGSSGRWREAFRDAICYWEPLRVVYNLILMLVAVVWLVSTWPHFSATVNLEPFLALSILALGANVCYCAAYLADIPLQYSPHRVTWPRARWVVWLAGMLVVLVLTNYWIADEVYPAVR
jgi:hypothetical protein